MSQMKCMVIDDEFHAVEVLVSFINQTPYLQLLDSTTDPLHGVELIRRLNPDLVFLDINMDKLSGLDIRELIDKKILTVFCTASSDHAIRGFELEITDYLLKPISYKRFLHSVERVYQVFSSRQPGWFEEPYILAKVDHKGKFVKIDLRDIEYIEASGNYVTFYHNNQKSMSLRSMREIETQLPETHFIRVQKSYIVSIQKILAVEYNHVVLKHSKNKVPIGQAFKAKLIELLSTRSIIKPPDTTE